MPELPPTELIQDKLLFTVLPAAVAALVAFLLTSLVVWLIFGRWRQTTWVKYAPSVAVFALIAGVVASPLLGSWHQNRIAAAKAAGDTDRAQELARSIQFELPFPWVPDGKWWHWGWYAIGLAIGVELLVRLPGVPVRVANLFRGVAAGVIASAVIHPGLLKPETRWWLPFVATLMAITWAVIDAVGRKNPGGAIAGAMAIVCGGAATVLIHDAAAGFTDVATFLFTGLAIITVCGWATSTDVNAAGAAAVVPVATLLLLHRGPESESPVPQMCYWLVGLAPLGLALFLAPPIAFFGTSRWATPVKWLIVAVPVGIAVYRCVTEAPMKFGEEQW